METPPTQASTPSIRTIAEQLPQWAATLGFQQVGITDFQLGEHPQHLRHWLAKQFHGSMHYMATREALRSHPETLLPGSLRVISVRMDYMTDNIAANEQLQQHNHAYISRYALGRDYHKVIRKRLSQLASLIDQQAQQHHCRAFVDSAPVLERAFAEKAGLGWIGKNTMLINPKAGSWFFLGEIYTDLALPVSQSFNDFHCGSCTACLDDCPTGAIVAPNQVDARRCISYLTIESKQPIPEPYRKPMGNRIYGCDDCQLVCPWNKFTQQTQEADFLPRHNLDCITLLELWQWDEATFLSRTEGSAIRRIGYQQWQRNIAVALGNAPTDASIIKALEEKLFSCSELVKEHILWALLQHKKR